VIEGTDKNPAPGADAVRQAMAGASAWEGPTGEEGVDDGDDIEFEPLRPGETSCDPLKLAFWDRNDLGNAERLKARFGSDLMYVGNIGWHVWDGRRWQREGGEELVRLRCYWTAKRIREEAAVIRIWATRKDNRQGLEKPDPIRAKMVQAHASLATSSGNAARTDAMLKQAVPFLLRHAREIDAQPWILNTAEAAIDLGDAPAEDGTVEIEHRAFRQDDLISRLAPTRFDPDAQAPHWLAFVASIFPDPEVRAFVQTWFGYCLTGDTREQCILICHGGGSNGKSTLIETISKVMGDYAATVSIATFLDTGTRGGGDATPDLARLPGVRLAIASEPAAGDRLSETVIKTITGGERILARHLFRDLFEYDPTFKVTIACNQKPTIRGQDHGIWRRIIMLPFTVTFDDDQIDRLLPEKLKGEGPGILNWLLDGYRLWREKGLTVPKAVRAAIDEYRSESDPVGQFIRAWTFKDPPSFINATDLYRGYVAWCRRNAVTPWKQTGFGRRCVDLGLKKNTSGTTSYLGIGLTKEAWDAIDHPDSLEGSGKHGHTDDEHDDR
jgi:putative DNA primase/helicase